MSLRLRIALLVIAVVTVVVAVVGEWTYSAAESELIEEVDLELLGRARTLVEPNRGALGFRAFDELPAPDEGQEGRLGPGVAFLEAVQRGTWARVIDPDGIVIRQVGRPFDAPIVVGSLPAEGDRAPTLGDGEIEGARARVVTMPIGELGYVQLARPLAEIDQSLDDLLGRIVLIGLLAVAAAGAVAWLLAGSTVEPIRRLTSASERVAATGDFDHPVDGAGGAEVGRLAASFNSMLAALGASRRQQHQLVMDASHELRTPLASLQTNVDVLRARPDLESEMRAAIVDDLHAEIGELGALVAELVDLATDVSEDEAAAPVELADLAAPIVERIGRRTGGSVALEVGRRAVVEGRPLALGRAIRNLVENAVKFTPAGSPVRVVVDGGTVTVHDRGPGIPEAEREQVFERFHRVESSRTLPGSGLGLAIVRQVAEAHGGTAGAHTSPEGGTAVGFTIPTVDD